MDSLPPAEIPPRYLPQRPFPAYSYVPGQWPHPISDPRGHSFGHRDSAAAALNPNQWQDSVEYLWGLDLFNHGYYWEAHESWEAVWKAPRSQFAVATFLKGLIKLAAAGVKAREGNSVGVQRHASRGVELLASVESAGSNFCGLNLTSLKKHAGEISRLSGELAIRDHSSVKPVFRFFLVLAP